MQLSISENVTLSILCIPEVISAFARLQREGRITPVQFNQLQSAMFKDLEDVQLVNVTENIVSRSVVLLRQFALPTLDALHLACALAKKPDVFVTADFRQEQAARELGLNTRNI